jgi:hypothetical protein
MRAGRANPAETGQYSWEWHFCFSRKAEAE